MIISKKVKASLFVYLYVTVVSILVYLQAGTAFAQTATPSPQLGSIGNFIYVVSTSGNLPLEGVSISLWQDGMMIATTATNAEGVYRFSDLSLGTYEVRLNPDTLPEFLSGVPAYSPDNGDDHAAMVTLTSEYSDNEQMDFAYTTFLTTLTRYMHLSGTVYRMDAEEVIPLSNVIVALGQEGQVTKYRNTDENGNYQFDVIIPYSHRYYYYNNDDYYTYLEYNDIGIEIDVDTLPEEIRDYHLVVPADFSNEGGQGIKLTGEMIGDLDVSQGSGAYVVENLDFGYSTVPLAVTRVDSRAFRHVDGVWMGAAVLILATAIMREQYGRMCHTSQEQSTIIE